MDSKGFQSAQQYLVVGAGRGETEDISAGRFVKTMENRSLFIKDCILHVCQVHQLMTCLTLLEMALTPYATIIAFISAVVPSATTVAVATDYANLNL